MTTPRLHHVYHRPSHDPARAVYDALQAEVRKRDARPYEAWTACESDAALRAATAVAPAMNLRPPAMPVVLAAEVYARGSADYVATWAYAIAMAMRGRANAQVPNANRRGG